MKFDQVMSFFLSPDFCSEVDALFPAIVQFVESLNLSDSFLHELQLLLTRYPDSQLEVKMSYIEKRRYYSVSDNAGRVLLFNENNSFEA